MTLESCVRQNFAGGEWVYRRVKQKHFALPDSAEAGFGRNASYHFSIFRQQGIGAFGNGGFREQNLFRHICSRVALRRVASPTRLRGATRGKQGTRLQ